MNFITTKKEAKIPMVEIFETVEGEGTRAGFPTTFIRVFHCNLRCTWCDTIYSYAPEKPVFWATVSEIITEVKKIPYPTICLTGGEPLIHGDRSMQLIQQLAELPFVEDIHIETNGAIDLTPFEEIRKQNPLAKDKVRFIMDYKLPASGEQGKMIVGNFAHLSPCDEVKFVIQDRHDFDIACQVIETQLKEGLPLFSPVFEKLDPKTLVNWMLETNIGKVKLNVQLHKYIWDPNTRGV